MHSPGWKVEIRKADQSRHNVVGGPVTSRPVPVSIYEFVFFFIFLLPVLFFSKQISCQFILCDFVFNFFLSFKFENIFFFLF